MMVRSFVANSSSSSFLIVGKSFDNNADAKALQEKFNDKFSDVQYARGWDEPYIAGVNIDLGIDDSCEMDAQEFLKQLTEAIEQCKKIGIEKPQIYGDCSYDS